MLFNSIEFVVFFLVVCFIYYLPFLKKYQVSILVLSSIYFYGTSSFKATALFLLSISINAIASYLVLYGNQKYSRLFSTLGVVINLLILIFFKYTSLLISTFSPENYIDSPVTQALLHIPLPIGISFFTFEGISLLVDVYQKRDLKQSWYAKNLPVFYLNTAFFISFFPHLIAGPILKAHSFMPQIGQKLFKNIAWEAAFKHLVVGYFLKIVIADNLKDQTMFLSAPFSGLHPIDLLSMLFAYSFQIFADFAGYSLIAIGLAEILGYNLVHNFNFPYISQTFSEFWRRWHISLSSWLREYLYIPLGGNRKGNVRTYINLFLVMFLGGLWHGATWSYALWGSVHGSALMIERAISKKTASIDNTFWQITKGFFVFLIVTFAWLFFKLPAIEDVVDFYKALLSTSYSDFNIQPRQFYIAFYTLPIIIYYLNYLLREKLKSYNGLFTRFSFAGYGLMLFMIACNSGFGGSFIYFRF